MKKTAFIIFAFLLVGLMGRRVWLAGQEKAPMDKYAVSKQLEGLFCSMEYANSAYEKTYWLPGSNDNLKHCAFFCELGRKCGKTEAFMVGLGKEVKDLVFGPGKPQLDDLRANQNGLELVEAQGSCFRACRERFPISQKKLMTYYRIFHPRESSHFEM